MTKKIDTRRQANIIVVCGSSGSGKSAWVKRQIKKQSRVIIWDIDDEYDGRRITNAAELVNTLKNAPRGKFRYVGKPKEFDFWCRCAFAWGNCHAVAEEIAGVTSPGKAPDGWHQLLSRGRKRGIAVYGITQRPSESDKTIMGNATLFHVGMMARAQDRAYMAKELDLGNFGNVDIGELQPLEFIEKDMKTRQVKKGKLRFSR